jgi:serine/threonine-protein kinase
VVKRDVEVRLAGGDGPVPSWTGVPVSREQREASARYRLEIGRTNRWGMRFVLVPPGAAFARPYYMQVGEVTREQFARFDARALPTAYTARSGKLPLALDGGPVTDVTHADALAFARRLSTEEGGRYRVPTDTEWEHAARAGDARGDNYWQYDPQQVAAFANVADRSIKRNARGWPDDKMAGHDDRAPGTWPAQRGTANRWGLRNMLGNAAEWVVEDSGVAGSATRRIHRGGSFRRLPPPVLGPVVAATGREGRRRGVPAAAGSGGALMDRAAALDLLGLPHDANPAEIARAWRAQRKPILRELNRHDAGEEPPELLAKLEALEAAYKLLQAPAPEEPEPETPPASAEPTPTRLLAKDEPQPEAAEPEPEPVPDAAPAPPPKPQPKPQPEGTPARSTGGVGLEPGTVLLGRYEVRSRISHRPEGDTYRATDRVRQTDVAVKVIDPALARDPRWKAAVKQGVLAASRLHHPNLARVLDLVPMQHTYLVTQELPRGSNLWDLVHGEDARPDRFTPELVGTIAAQATRALAYLHRTTKHASLRPESVWVADDGTVEISDFGFEALHTPLREKRLSRSKLGTAYWAPEQYRDEVAVDERADQHALALVLYEVLSGKPAMGRTVAIRSFRRDLPRRLTGALERALASKPGRRFADMDAFGFAAFEGYEVEGAVPSEPALRTTVLPVLCLLALAAAFVFSPLGTLAKDALADAVGRWRATDARRAQADLEWRQLAAMSARLEERRDELGDEGRAELTRIRSALRASIPDAEERATLQGDLTQVLTQFVETSARRADKALEGATKELDALEDLASEHDADSERELREAVRALENAPVAERLDAVVAVVRRQAGAESRRRQWSETRRVLLGSPDLAAAFRARLEAENALLIGDEAATGRAYEEAATKLESATDEAEDVVDAARGLPPHADKAPRIAVPLEEARTRACAEALLGTGAALTAEAELARVLDGLLADAAGDVRSRHLVDPAGFWALEVALGPRTVVLGGTWQRAGDAQRLRVTVVNGRPLEAPFEVAAERGEGMPGQGDLVAALAAAPRSVRALWCVRAEAGTGLPPPAFAQDERTLRAGELAIAGACPAGEGACVLVEGRRFEPKDDAFQAKVRVPGDVLGTWIRAHAARGLASGPGAWMRVRTDGVAPRVHLLEPASDAALEPGSEVTVRAIVYDSNLETLEVAGEACALRPDDVYVLLEIPMTVPPAGGLTLPVRAVDAAGNETTVEWTWRGR